METKERVIKQIKLDDDVIFDTDKEGNYTLRFQIKLGSYDVILRPPSYREHTKLYMDFANLIQLLAVLNPHIIYPDSEKLSTDGFFTVWSEECKYIFTNNRLIKRLEKILFKYFEFPMSKRQFRKVATMYDLQKMFAFLCTLDDVLKKNAKYILKTVYGATLPNTNFSNSSTKSSDGQAETYSINPF